MIKHRFILRDTSDFKVFAAIPVETSLLTWKKWTRPPDWEAFGKLVYAAAEATQHAQVAFLEFGKAAQELRMASLRCLDAGEDDGVAQLAKRMTAHVEWAMIAETLVDSSAQELLRAAVSLPPPAAEQTPELFSKAIGVLAPLLAQDVDPDRAVATLRAGYDEHVAVLSKPHKPIREEARDLVKKMRATFGVFVDRLTDIEQSMDRRKVIAEEFKELLSSDPLPDVPCPPGVPFAAYTVEFGETVVSVIEGCAWVSSRQHPSVEEKVKREIMAALDSVPKEAARAAVTEVKRRLETNPPPPDTIAPATEEEKRVVEIVSQMLTERSLNPKADTKIPVREVDPAKAHHAREAEKRAVHGPTVRTIKFEVTPPRYLREAAERIISSPRRAHWVVGHWRNQFHGEKRALRHQVWIKPHIRGLGEASATVTRVAAPHPAKPVTA